MMKDFTFDSSGYLNSAHTLLSKTTGMGARDITHSSSDCKIQCMIVGEEDGQTCGSMVHLLCFGQKMKVSKRTKLKIFQCFQ